MLNLSYNNFTGSLPSELGNLTRLRYLYVDRNHLSGEITSSLGNMTDLKRLYLYNNEFTGPIPSTFTTANLQNITRAYFKDNNFDRDSNKNAYMTGDVLSWYNAITNKSRSNQ